MIRAAAPDPVIRVLENGCGVGTYLPRLRQFAPHVHGLEYDAARATEAAHCDPQALVVCGAGEHLPYPANMFDLILSNEVIEHVQDDRLAVSEMARVLRPGGRLVVFCPNRWYPVEQHGIYWRGRYIFGNIPLVNYLPNVWRNKLAPHVRTYTWHGLRHLFAGLPVRILRHTRIFGGYDNLIARFGSFGRFIRTALYAIENSPLNMLGLSHLVVAEKIG